MSRQSTAFEIERQIPRQVPVGEAVKDASRVPPKPPA